MTDNTETKLAEGTAAWTVFGQQVEIRQILPNGYLVQPAFEVDTYNGDIETGFGSLEIETKLYAKSPHWIYDEQIAAKQKELKYLRNDLLNTNSEITAAERTKEDRLQKLKKWDALERIEQLVDGKITHLLIKDYREFEIRLFDGTMKTDSSVDSTNIKLLTLFGRTKGDFEWRLNQYSDGSGGSTTVYPCLSEEEAVEKRHELIVKNLESASDLDRKMREDGRKRGSYVINAVDMAIRYDVEVHIDGMMEIYRQDKVAEHEDQIKRHQESIDKSTAAVTKSQDAIVDLGGLK